MTCEPCPCQSRFSRQSRLSQDDTKVRLREDGREGIIDGLTELVVGPSPNPDSRTQYRINVGDPNLTLAIEDDLLVLTDQDGVVLTVKQKDEYRRVVTHHRFVKTAQDGRTVMRGARDHPTP